MSAVTFTPASRPAAEPRGCVPTLAVLLIMVGILATGVIAQNAVAEAPPQPVEVSHGVTITPPEGWEFGGRSEDGNTIVLSQGSGSLAISVEQGMDPVAALNALRAEWLAAGTVTAAEVTQVDSVRPGETAFGLAYSGTFPDLGTPVEGEVTGFAGTGIAVLFDGWAGFGDYRAVREELNAIVAATVIP